jgi:hypothetical protein
MVAAPSVVPLHNFIPIPTVRPESSSPANAQHLLGSLAAATPLLKSIKKASGTNSLFKHLMIKKPPYLLLKAFERPSHSHGKDVQNNI